MPTSQTSSVFTGNGVDGIYIYGAQCEESTYATSYIPNNSGGTITRAADVCAGAGDVNTFNSTEGVLYAEMSALSDDLTNRAISLSDGTLNNGVQMFYFNTSNRIRFRVYALGTLQATINAIGVAITDTHKIALKWESGFMSVFVDGVTISTLAIASTPSGLDRLNFDLGQGSSDFHGNVKQVLTFNTALSDLDLAILTGATTYNTFAEMAVALNYTVYE
jgi:hypothetical protein